MNVSSPTTECLDASRSFDFERMNTYIINVDVEENNSNCLDDKERNGNYFK